MRRGACSVLRSVPSDRRRRSVYRLAHDRPLQDLFAEHGLDKVSGDEANRLLVEFGYRVDGDAVLDNPFRRRRSPKSRFSDGSFPVFYSALDSATAEAEVRHRAPTYLGGVGKPRTAYYWLFRCVFEGVEKDLRPQIGTWPHLIHKRDYTFCNQLGAEAVELKVDGLVTWSARRRRGVNLPVFSRRALRDPGTIRLVAITYDPAAGSVSIR